MMLRPETIPTVVALYLFWLLGLYVVTRSPRSAVSQLAAAAQFSLALFLFGEALQGSAGDETEWRRWTAPFWSGVPLSAILWPAVVVQLTRSHGAGASIQLLRRGGYAAFAVVAGGEALSALLGLFDGPIYHWSGPTVAASGLLHARPGPLYGPFALVTLLATSGPVLLLELLRRETRPDSSLRPQLRWLMWSGIAFWASATYLTANAFFGLGLPTYPGHLTLAIGTAAMAWNVAQYSALLEGEVLVRDFFYFLTASTVLAAFYSAVYLVSGQPFSQRWLLALLLLVLGTVAVQALFFEAGRQVLDYLFFRREVRDLRQRLRSVETRAARQLSADAPVATLTALDGEGLQNQVADAMRQLHSVGALAEHPLLAMLPNAHRQAADLSGGDGSPLARGRALQTLLLRSVERLRPEGQRPAQITPGWLQYLALEEEYVNGRPNKDLAQDFHVSEATFHRARRQAIAHLTAELAAQEERGAVVERK